MRALGILALALVLGVGSAYGEERSCEDWVSEVAPQLEQKYRALKVYARAEDRTREYKAMRKKNNSDEKVAALTKEVLIALQAIEVSAALGKRSPVLSLEETIQIMAIPSAVMKDAGDTSSEVVMLCIGRMRLRSGTSHFMLLVTKDEDGDHFWESVTIK